MMVTTIYISFSCISWLQSYTCPKQMLSLFYILRIFFCRLGSDDYVWDHYEESVPMSTYLVAFVVSKFEFKVIVGGYNHNSTPGVRPAKIYLARPLPEPV